MERQKLIILILKKFHSSNQGMVQNNQNDYITQKQKPY